MPTASATSADRRLAALFPDSAGDAPSAPWWRRRVGITVIGLVVLALIVSGVIAANAFGSQGASYRTIAAGDHDVDAVLSGVATIEPVSQATVAFPVSGTVSSVNVKVGDAVGASGTLASLDTTSLMQTMHSKQATLAQDQLILSKALAGESVSGLSSGSGTATGSAGGSSSSSSGSGSASLSAVRSASTSRIVLAAAPVDPALTAAQQAVLTAQQNVDSALTASANALNSATTVCAPVGGGSPSAGDLTACQTAIQAVSTAQTAVSTAQQALATASTALDTLLAQRAAQTPTTPTTPTTTPSSGSSGRTGTGSTSGTSATSGTSSSGGSSSGASSSGRSSTAASSSPTAADLVAYQKAVDAAALAVLAAQQGVAQATISSPIAGTVVAVDMNVGDSVTSGSSTENIVVQGTGGYEVSTTVSVDKVTAVAVGQAATVLPDGSHTDVAGKVVSISVMPDTSSTTTTSYRVVIGLTNPNAKLNNGATGTVSIMTENAKSALAVPTSAITTTGTRHFVTVLDGDNATRVAVQVGVLGNTWTEIKSGVKQGEQVVLANVSAALPSSATASTNATQNSSTSRFGGFGGGGFGGGTGGFGGGNGGGGTRTR